MTRYIAEFVLDSDVRLADDAKPLIWRDEAGDFELKITNVKAGFARPSESLSAELIFSADDLTEAQEKSQDLLASILNSLVWVTVSMIRQSKLVRIVDWTPGLTMRPALIFAETPTHAVSEPLLRPELLDSAKDLFRTQGEARTQSALRWFRLGIAAQSTEDQFTYFWFALETAAEKLKSAGKVTTKCLKCDTDLFCKTCDTYPVHRRFSADAIRDLIIRSFSNEDSGREAFHILQKIRHTLLHGRRIESIAASLPCDPREATNRLALVARRAILEMGDYRGVEGGRLNLAVISAEDIVRSKMIAAAHVEIGAGGDPNKPELSHVGKVEVAVRYPGEPDPS